MAMPQFNLGQRWANIGKTVGDIAQMQKSTAERKRAEKMKGEQMLQQTFKDIYGFADDWGKEQTRQRERKEDVQMQKDLLESSRLHEKSLAELESGFRKEETKEEFDLSKEDRAAQLALQQRTATAGETAATAAQKLRQDTLEFHRQVAQLDAVGRDQRYKLELLQYARLNKQIANRQAEIAQNYLMHQENQALEREIEEKREETTRLKNAGLNEKAIEMETLANAQELALSKQEAQQQTDYATLQSALKKGVNRDTLQAANEFKLKTAMMYFPEAGSPEEALHLLHELEHSGKKEQELTPYDIGMMAIKAEIPQYSEWAGESANPQVQEMAIQLFTAEVRNLLSTGKIDEEDARKAMGMLDYHIAGDPEDQESFMAALIDKDMFVDKSQASVNMSAGVLTAMGTLLAIKPKTRGAGFWRLLANIPGIKETLVPETENNILSQLERYRDQGSVVYEPEDPEYKRIEDGALQIFEGENPLIIEYLNSLENGDKKNIIIEAAQNLRILLNQQAPMTQSQVETAEVLIGWVLPEWSSASGIPEDITTQGIYRK